MSEIGKYLFWTFAQIRTLSHQQAPATVHFSGALTVATNRQSTVFFVG
jgi:hypothetical protein